MGLFLATIKWRQIRAPSSLSAAVGLGSESHRAGDRIQLIPVMSDLATQASHHKLQVKGFLQRAS
jgi:hypothetical protein